jgi:hypothetical protein
MLESGQLSIGLKPKLGFNLKIMLELEQQIEIEPRGKWKCHPHNLFLSSIEMAD